jgi:glutathione peroxidase
MFSKIDVNGDNTHQVYKFLRTHSKLHDADKGTAKEIPWNFAKFLVDSEGLVQGYYEPSDTVESTYKQVKEMLAVA